MNGSKDFKVIVTTVDGIEKYGITTIKNEKLILEEIDNSGIVLWDECGDLWFCNNSTIIRNIIITEG